MYGCGHCKTFYNNKTPIYVCKTFYNNKTNLCGHCKTFYNNKTNLCMVVDIVKHL